jgi:hypothetical protein
MIKPQYWSASSSVLESTQNETPALRVAMKPLLLKTLRIPMLALSLQLVLCPLPAMADGQANKNQASKTYDANGKLMQKTNDKGRHYNAKGQYQGKTTSDGKHYDAKGKFTGKTVASPTGSKSYDAKGKYQGKVKPLTPAKIEKRDANGKLVEVKKTDDPGYW